MSQEKNSSLNLVNAIDSQLKRVHTQSLDLSFNELLDMKENHELDISPEYQRLFQWSEGARSRFIESLLLEMPVPPIYVIENEDGKYLLIDGLQRISSYLHLRGKLVAPHLDPPIDKGQMLTLSDCDIVKELNGLKFDDLSIALQIKLKRAFVRVEVVRKGSDPKFKYHMFKRLNTGGELLTAQQLRNCTIRLLDSTFNDFIIKCSQNTNFRKCTSILTRYQSLTAFDQELVLRFFALKNNLDKFSHDVADFLTDYMEEVSDPDTDLVFDYGKEEDVFVRTFDLLSQTLGDKSFGTSNKTRDKVTKGFSVYHYEAITIGIQKFVEQVDMSDSKPLEDFKNKLEEVKFSNEFINLTTGGGKNSKGPIRGRIDFVKSKIDELI